MAFNQKACRVLATAAFALMGIQPVFATTICKPSFVLRFASDADEVCVPPPTRQRTVAENARAPLLWTPGPFGPKTCAQGYVWREAFPGDLVCVWPAVRTETLQDNALAASRRQ